MSDHDLWEIGQLRQDLNSLRDSSFVRQNAVDARVGNLQRRVSRLEEEQAQLRSLLIDLDNRLTELEKDKAP